MFNMKYLSLFILFSFSSILNAQINFTANDQVPSFDGAFGFGVNAGSNAGWDDEAEADIASGNPALGIAGAGCNTKRTPLPEHFLEFWGYDIRLDEYQYFENLGMQDLTVFIGFPSDDHQDPNSYCPDHQSHLFDNMYLPIWDGGANGTPINDDNYYAKYLFEMVNIYQDHVKFWEVWNEPDFDYSASGYLDPGQEGNWWENVPDPCDYKLRAPVYHYIRLLRISYEVIKFVDPDAFVAVGGLGYESFLDIIMRHSDNPDNGLITSEYPLAGGAYFDALSYHSYPHFSLKEYDNDLEDFIFFRHSDAAMQEVVIKKNDFETVLENYGYNDVTYPEKVWLITESNVPAEKFNPDYFGSIPGQRNFIIKTVVACQKNNILQFHVYKLGEDYPIGEGYNEFDRMGLYENLDDVNQYDQVLTEEGIAYKTTSDAIGNASYNEAKTLELNLPDDIDGAAFLHPDGSYTYVIWAKTTIDDSEVANANYSFPASMNINLLEKRNWNYSQTNNSTELGPNNISLTGAPIFLHDISVDNIPPIANFAFSVQSNCAPFTINFSDLSTSPNTWSWSFPGGSPNISSLQNPSIIYNTSGTYTATLLVSNDSGNDAINITFTLGSELVYELNEELCFGDQVNVNGTIYDESNPNGTEVITGGSSNGCDSTVIINLTFSELLETNLNATICDGDSYPFGGNDLTETGIYTYETTTNSGCDSLANLNLVVEETAFSSFEFNICENDDYPEDTIIIDTLFSLNGCDSLIIITNIYVEENYFTEIEETIFEGETYTVGSSTYDETGVFYDILTAQNGCDSIIELTLTVEIVDAVFEFNDPKQIDLQTFPNPFSKKVNINFISTQTDFNGLQFFDSNGHLIEAVIKNQSFQNGRFYFTLNFAALPKGVYWCRILLSEGVYTQKLILL